MSDARPAELQSLAETSIDWLALLKRHLRPSIKATEQGTVEDATADHVDSRPGLVIATEVTPGQDECLCVLAPAALWADWPEETTSDVSEEWSDDIPADPALADAADTGEELEKTDRDDLAATDDSDGATADDAGEEEPFGKAGETEDADAEALPTISDAVLARLATAVGDACFDDRAARAAAALQVSDLRAAFDLANAPIIRIPIVDEASGESISIWIASPLPRPDWLPVRPVDPPAPQFGSEADFEETPVNLGGSFDFGRGALEEIDEPVEPVAEKAEDAPRNYPTEYIGSGRLRALPVRCIVTLAEKRITVGQLMQISPGVLITFSKTCEEPLDLYVNNHLYCRGEAVKIGEKFGLKVNVVNPKPERICNVLT